MKPGTRKTILLLILFLAGMPRAQSSGVVIEKIIAVVNGDILTLTELKEQSIPLIRHMSAEASGRSGTPRVEETERQLLQSMIDRRLQLQEAKKLGIATSPAEVDAYIEDLREKSKIPSEEAFKAALAKEGLTLERLKKDVEDQLTFYKVLNKEVRSAIVIHEAEVRKAYEDQIDRFVQPSQVRLRYILIPRSADATPEGVPREKGRAEGASNRLKEASDFSEIGKAFSAGSMAEAGGDIGFTREKARAEEALNRLKAGADFSEIAKAYSAGPMAEAGGDIGFVKRGELHPDVDKVAFSLKVGEFSPIIPIPSGLVIIKVEEKRTPIKSYADVAEELRGQIFEKRVEQEYKEWVQTLRAKAYVEVKQ